MANPIQNLPLPDPRGFEAPTPPVSQDSVENRTANIATAALNAAAPVQPPRLPRHHKARAFTTAAYQGPTKKRLVGDFNAAPGEMQRLVHETRAELLAFQLRQILI
jgi:hypothetical protein